ncbi:MAG: FtsX-like permease family protein [Bacteroidales bacterium]|nr:FtsX-like permease family protein [Bacteroidales bacterium]MBQ6729331.1 FtsX-like permease family protein [Bacteroidales bacterium]
MNSISDKLIKILSLGIGLAIGIVLIAKVCFELSYDSFYKDVDRIYIIQTGIERQGESKNFGQVSGAVAPGFKAEVPGVEEATRITSLFSNNRYTDEDGHIITGNLRLADSCFFKVFDCPILAGDPAQVLARPRCLMVSESFAEKLGGVDECIGRIIANEDVPDLKMTIEGVFKDFPKNGSMDSDLLLSMVSYSKSSIENWVGNDRYRAFVKLQQGVDPQSLDDAIRKMQETHQPLEELEQNGTKLWYYLTPFGKDHIKESSVRSMVILLSIVAALLILISLLNYILIVISEMVRRSKEIGVRKCYGADAFDIHWLLARETFVHLLLALALTVAIIFASKGLIQNLLGMSFETLLVTQSILVISLVLALVVVVSVFVPAQLYMRIPVSVAFRNYTENSRRWKIGLLGVQVFINVFVATMLLIVALQYKKMVNSDPGYNYENTYYISMYDGDQAAQRRVVETLGQMPEVTHTGVAYHLPLSYASGDNVYLPGDDRELFNVADCYEATPSFYEMMGFDFVDGRIPADSTEVAVSEAFVKRMADFADWSDGAVGKQVQITGHGNWGMELAPFTISGVYRDIRIHNLVDLDTRPSVRFYGSLDDGKSYMPYVVFRTNAKLDEAAMQKVSEAIATALDGKQMQILSWSDQMRSAYDDSRKMRNTIFIGAIFALMIAVLGLVGFVRDESNRRSKEMAIRKINGATARDVLRIFAWDVLKLSLVMAVLASIGAFFVAHRWLEQFAERIGLSPLYFIIGAVTVLLIVTAVVVVSSNRVARMNPVKSLKNN